MNRKFIIGLLLLVAFSISLHSCRNDILNEQHAAVNPNASKFRIVKLKDIPKIEGFIHKKSGRQDFKLPLSGNSILGKNESVSEIDTNAIIQSQSGNTTWYTFSIQNAEDTISENIYNLQVKEVGGHVESAEIVAYKPSATIPVNFQKFTGQVQSYNMEGNLLAEADYTNGINDDCPITIPGGGDGTGGGDGSPGGGIGIGGDDNHPWGDDPSNPGYGGGNDNGGTPPGDGGGGDCTIGMNNQGEVVLICDGGTNISPYIFRGANLSPNCSGGPGVVIVHNTPNDPCAKLKAQNSTPDFKAKVNLLETNLNLKKETGYVEKNNGTYEYKDEASINSGSNSLTLGDPTPDMKGFLHTHVNDYTDDDGTERIGFKIFFSSRCYLF